MKQEYTQNNDTAPPAPFDIDLSILAVGAERVPWLAALIETARSDMRPRDFQERHFVDEMAINKWRLLRIYGMEKAVYEHQLAGFRPQSSAEPNEDMYHLARAYASENDGIILAALSRLETRFHRQFIAACKMLMALRRFTDSVPNHDHPSVPNHDRKGVATPTEKEANVCHSPSNSSSDPSTTQSPNNSNPSSNPSEPSKSS
jgi:hypothetical protein